MTYCRQLLLVEQNIPLCCFWHAKLRSKPLFITCFQHLVVGDPEIGNKIKHYSVTCDHKSKYWVTSIYVILISVNTSICNLKLNFFWSVSLYLHSHSWSFLYSNLLHASLIFWSLSIAYNEVHLHLQTVENINIE